MSKGKHTLYRKPWKTINPATGNPEVDDCWLDIVDADGAKITTAYIAEAEHIVKAVNSHDQLVEALELAWFLRKENAENCIAPEWLIKQGVKTAGDVIDNALKAAGEEA